MFIGHFAIGFGAKKFAPKVSLGVLLLACQLADLIWPNLVMLGVEEVRIAPGITAMVPLDFVRYPWSHSLVMLLLWAVLFALLYAVLRRAGLKAALVIAVVAFSHWLLDALSHRPDMPISLDDSMRVGAGLWNFPPWAIGVELLMFAAGVWLYARETVARDRRGKYGLWALVAVLFLVYVANLFGPPPPSVTALAWSAQGLWLFVACGFWVDRHRVSMRRAQDPFICAQTYAAENED